MNKFVKFLGKNRPTILTAIGIVGMAATAVLAYKSYPAVTDKLNDKADEVYEMEGRDQLTKTEKVQVYAKTLWPTFAIGGISAGMIALGLNDQVKRTSALATAYYLSESTLKEYQEKVIEEIGERKEQAIRDKVAVSKMEKTEPVNQTIVYTEGSQPWIYDTFTNVFFRMNYEKYRRIIAEATNLMITQDFISVEELYYMLQVKLPEGKNWHLLGWAARNGRSNLKDYYRETLAMREINGESVPCMIVEWQIDPKYDYNVYGH